jgi:hypothetical protein
MLFGTFSILCSEFCSLVGGADAAKFTVNSLTGALAKSFMVAHLYCGNLTDQ